MTHLRQHGKWYTTCQHVLTLVRDEPAIEQHDLVHRIATERHCPNYVVERAMLELLETGTLLEVHGRLHATECPVAVCAAQ